MSSSCRASTSSVATGITATPFWELATNTPATPATAMVTTPATPTPAMATTREARDTTGTDPATDTPASSETRTRTRKIHHILSINI